MEKKKVGLSALGCKVNRYETDAYAALFRKAGFEIAPFDEVCDIYVINTCSVTNLGDRKSRQMIRRAKQKNPNAVVVATGCYAQISYEKVKSMEEVDLCIGTAQRSRIVELTQMAMRGEDVDAYVDIMKEKAYEELEAESVTERTRAYIKIEDGCDNFCSYCIIPYARGPVRSRSAASILAEAERLAGLGYKEVVLTGISVSFYGKDGGGCSLIDIVEKVCAVRGIERVRLSSIDPRAFTEDFVERLAAQRKVCPHFHISLQSGSAQVLKAMNRKYTPQFYLEVLERIRRAMPDAAITTDIIEGFPGETEENFAETKNFVREAGFAKVHVFPYSERKGTAAAQMEQLPMSIREARASALGKIAEEEKEKFEESFIGKCAEVLFEKKKDGQNEGLTKNYLRVFVNCEGDLEGETREVRIIGYEDGKLTGEICE
ncbi:MAG: tRNA (N(6)-L-threonylcarbamoyladenosine(37)-C(2))-methylthiotransferase MtaB [Clostridia bacterium]|nr:tRNA (N(6)-L-threonylcarbamoyladenosine(37)-C(2))-methylthiotransferase MtaB [Clostridia bacterium]